ncbi:hypothetical protein Sfulv_06540 [Streptomyces fulvorobeus]|uniref:Methyltransferase domain-containing protein n=1 Tax=Streptomyces fulvorobeus TaxID=284028 RepID=A0A7J0C1N1_9ACTN|nr:hypothetical protein Sfulv_06540 [Streptomyces fulvorobeus]
MHWYEDDSLWSDFAPTMFSADRTATAAALVESSPLLDFPPGCRVLDLCCGPGLFLVPLARREYAVTGVDLSPRCWTARGAPARGRGPKSAWPRPTC